MITKYRLDRKYVFPSHIWPSESRITIAWYFSIKYSYLTFFLAEKHGRDIEIPISVKNGTKYAKNCGSITKIRLGLGRVAKTLHSSYEPNPEISKASYF